MRIQYTKAGLRAIFAAAADGIELRPTYFKIGRSVLPFSGEDYTDVADQVYPATDTAIDDAVIARLQTMMRYFWTEATENKATFTIILDDTIGDSREQNAVGNTNFLIGNIGLFHRPVGAVDARDDVLLVILSNDIAPRKYRRVSANEASDIQEYYASLTFKDITKSISVLTDVKLNFTNLMSCASISELPPASGAPYNAYIINDDNAASALAIRRIDKVQGAATWDFYYPNEGMRVPASSFAPDVGIGAAVMFKSGRFELCDGNDELFPYIGIRTGETTIRNTGRYTPGITLRVGATYYASETGGLTFIKTLYQVGVAVSYDTLALFFTSSETSKAVNNLAKTPTILLGDTTKFVVSVIQVVVAGSNYVNGAATINNIPVLLTTSNGAVVGITGAPSQFFDSDIAGNYQIVQAGNSSGSGRIVTAYATGEEPIIGQLQYAHLDDPVVQKSYLRKIIEQSYQFTEISLTDFNAMPIGQYIVNAASTALNAPESFPGGQFLARSIETSTGAKLATLQSILRPQLLWTRSSSDGTTYTAWQFNYATWFPGA